MTLDDQPQLRCWPLSWAADDKSTLALKYSAANSNLDTSPQERRDALAVISFSCFERERLGGVMRDNSGTSVLEARDQRSLGMFHSNASGKSESRLVVLPPPKLLEGTIGVSSASRKSSWLLGS